MDILEKIENVINEGNAIPSQYRSKLKDVKQYISKIENVKGNKDDDQAAVHFPYEWRDKVKEILKKSLGNEDLAGYDSTGKDFVARLYLVSGSACITYHPLELGFS